MRQLKYNCSLEPSREIVHEVLDLVRSPDGREILISVPSMDYKKSARRMALIFNLKWREVYLAKSSTLIGPEDQNRIVVGQKAQLLGV